MTVPTAIRLRPPTKGCWKVGHIHAGRPRKTDRQVLPLVKQLKAARIAYGVSQERLSKILGYDRYYGADATSPTVAAEPHPHA